MIAMANTSIFVLVPTLNLLAKQADSFNARACFLQQDPGKGVLVTQLFVVVVGCCAAKALPVLTDDPLLALVEVLDDCLRPDLWEEAFQDSDGEVCGVPGAREGVGLAPFLATLFVLAAIDYMLLPLCWAWDGSRWDLSQWCPALLTFIAHRDRDRDRTLLAGFRHWTGDLNAILAILETSARARSVFIPSWPRFSLSSSSPSSPSSSSLASLEDELSDNLLPSSPRGAQ